MEEYVFCKLLGDMPPSLMGVPADGCSSASLQFSVGIIDTNFPMHHYLQKGDLSPLPFPWLASWDYP